MKRGDRIMPHDLPIEAAVLGAVMIEKSAIHEVSDIFPSEDVFYSESNKLIYKAIKGLLSEGVPIDILTVIQRTRDNKDFKKIGGAEKASYYISQLTIKVNASDHITTHARFLVEMYIKRQLIIKMNKIEEGCYDDENAFVMLDELQEAVIEVSGHATGGNTFSTYKDLVLKAIDIIKDRRSGEVESDRLSTGFPSIDKVWTKMGKGEVSILAARPAMGKTALAMSFVNRVGIELGKKVAVFSLEMTKLSLIMRVLSSQAKVSSDKIKNGINITDKEWDDLVYQAGEISKAEVFVDDTPSLSLTAFKSKLQRLYVEMDGIDLVVIDYMQLMTAKEVKGTREQEIAHISRTLKELAKELSLPIVSLAQLSRAVEVRGGAKIPMLSDLRESGGIEQDADQVMFIHRPEYYGITEDEEGNSTLGLAELIFAKNRGGSTETVKLKFIGQYTRFEEWEENEWDEQPHQAQYQDPIQETQGYGDLENSTEFDFIP